MSERELRVGDKVRFTEAQREWITSYLGYKVPHDTVAVIVSDEGVKSFGKHAYNVAPVDKAYHNESHENGQWFMYTEDIELIEEGDSNDA